MAQVPIDALESIEAVDLKSLPCAALLELNDATQDADDNELATCSEAIVSGRTVLKSAQVPWLRKHDPVIVFAVG